MKSYCCFFTKIKIFPTPLSPKQLSKMKHEKKQIEHKLLMNEKLGFNRKTRYINSVFSYSSKII
uniref:Uncharacterized protein n=1 Tax=viral metagenome TaxID=1070528 RepID=A0A6C0DQT0_9ZZZZ